MRFLQLRINYSENNANFYRLFAWPLQQWLAQRYFFRWTIARGWQHGPHYLLTFDAGSPFYCSEWNHAIVERAADFLRAHPSAPVAEASYRVRQARLDQIEAAGIDPDVIEQNNTARSFMTDATALAARYESVTQWRSVFDLDVMLRKPVMTHWTGDSAANSEHFAFGLMIMLACVYPPAPSHDPEIIEYNGFLSYHSNYLFWHHALAPAQQLEITRRVEAGHAAKGATYGAWLTDLEAALAQPGHPAAQLGQRLVDGFLTACALAQDGLIHARSPFPPNRLAARDGVSSFHQKYFYDDAGEATAFGLEFCGYRWLLNVVYRTLPLLGISPMTRQMLNYSLNRLQQHQAQADAIRRIRMLMLTEAAQPNTDARKIAA